MSRFERPSTTRVTTLSSRLVRSMDTLGIEDCWGCGASQGIHSKLELSTVGPYLTFMHTLNASGQEFKGIIARENAVSTRSKGFHHQVSFGCIQQHDQFGVRHSFMKFPGNTEAAVGSHLSGRY